ncbi:MAG: ATP-binding protein [Phycisphaerales bacterium]|nr:hypothetical protein [Planctomycetota bacterium]
MGRFLRKLVPGHASLISSALVMSTAVLLSALGALWWTVQQAQVAESHASAARTLQAIAQTVGAQLERGIADRDLAGIRMIVLEAARGGRLSMCRVVLGDGSVLADSDVGAITSKTIPEKLPPVSSAALGEHRFELAIPGRGTAILEMQPSAESAEPQSLQFAFAGIAVGALVAVGAASVVIRRRGRPFTLVADALSAVASGERDLAALELADSTGGVGTAWNEFLRELARHRARERLESVASGRVNDSAHDDLALKLVDSMWHGVVFADEEMRIRYCNGAAAIFLGGTRESLAGTPIAECLKSSETGEGLLRLSDAKNRGRVVFECGVGEGDVRTVLRVSARSVAAGGYAILLEDVTQQRVADRSKNAFVEQATHELRTPLTNIRLYVEALIDNPNSEVATRSQHLNVVNQEVRRLERIVGDMLSVSEIEAGTLKLALHDVRLPSLFTDLEAEFAGPARAKNIALKFDLHPKLPTIVGDRDKLILAITNVIGNAIKYTPEGGTVRVSARPVDSDLVVEVADSGIGIRAEDIERVFERFYRAHDPRVEKIVGTGLGLALARDVLRLHGGDISVQSTPDRGSTFALKFPIRSPMSRAA